MFFFCLIIKIGQKPKESEQKPATMASIVSQQAVAKAPETASEVDKQKQQQSIKKIPSVKPPPPSTKIPKSAVVMPDDPRSVSSSATLDFGFGDILPIKSEKPQQQAQPEVAPVQEKTPEKPQGTF